MTKTIKWTIAITVVVALTLMIVINWEVAQKVFIAIGVMLGLWGSKKSNRKLIMDKIKKRDKKMEDELNEVDKPTSFSDRINNRNKRNN